MDNIRLIFLRLFRDVYQPSASYEAVNSVIHIYLLNEQSFFTPLRLLHIQKTVTLRLLRKIYVKTKFSLQPSARQIRT